MPGYTEVTRGAAIMRHYSNPAHWVDGATVHPTFRGKMVIRVPECEITTDNTQQMVLANVTALEAWAASVSLLPAMPDHLVMNVPDNGTFVVVPKRHWDRVKQRLAAL